MTRLDEPTRVGEVRTDEELVELILAGEGEVFAELYERYRLRAYRLAYGMTGRREAAEDLTQEIFLRAYEKLGQFKGRARFATWLYRLMVNHCLQYRERTLKKSEERMEELEEEGAGRGGLVVAGEAERALIEQQKQQIIHRALLSLKPELRMAVILRNLEGLSYEQIAERMDCSVGAVGTRLHRAHKLLAQKLSSLRGEY